MRIITIVGLVLFCIWLLWNISQVEKYKDACEGRGGVVYKPHGRSVCLDKSIVK